MSQARQADIDLYIENGAATQRLLRPYYLMADKQKLGQVIRNLISNGIKFSQAGGSIRVKLSLILLSGQDDKNTSFCYDYLKRLYRGRVRTQSDMGLSTSILYHAPREDENKVFLRLEVIDSGAGISKVHRGQLHHIILCVEITHSYL